MFPSFTLENYVTVQTQRDYFKPFMNSVVISVGSTILALIVAIPSAWAMAFFSTRKTKDILMWMLSTKMMPAVAFSCRSICCFAISACWIPASA